MRSRLIEARERLERESALETRLISASHVKDLSETGQESLSTDSANALIHEFGDIRSELADLFGVHAVEKNAFPLGLSAPVSVSARSDAKNNESEDLHLDSVKNYLAQLLDRSNVSASTPASPDNRRKASDQQRSSDQRVTRQPVKSFLDSYMETHVSEPLGASDSTPEQPVVDVTSETPPQSVMPRTPIDVKSIRESMDSFRAVAIQSVENALLSHDRRLAKGRFAVRQIWIAGLIAVTTMIFLVNIAQGIQFSLPNWLMIALVELGLMELCLRIQGIRKQQKDLRAAVLTPTSALRSVGEADDLDRQNG